MNSTPGLHVSGYQVKQYDPSRRRVQLILGLIGIAVLCWASYELGVNLSGYRNEQQGQEVLRLRNQVSQLETQRTESMVKLAFLERSSQVESQAALELKQTLNSLESKIRKLQKEVAFYKSIVAPSSVESGLRLQDFSLSKGAATGAYDYRLVLTQIRGKDRVARGMVSVKLQGKRSGQSATLSLSDLNGNDSDSIKFAFKYFQDIEGSLVIPDDFVPASIQVKVTPKSKWLDAIEESYSWNKTLSGGL